jgi:hypothetical protein
MNGREILEDSVAGAVVASAVLLVWFLAGAKTAIIFGAIIVAGTAASLLVWRNLEPERSPETPPPSRSLRRRFPFEDDTVLFAPDRIPRRVPVSPDSPVWFHPRPRRSSRHSEGRRTYLNFDEDS